MFIGAQSCCAVERNMHISTGRHRCLSRGALIDASRFLSEVGETNVISASGCIFGIDSR